MNSDLITRIEEHVIAMQDADVAAGASTHAETIALLREAKEELTALVDCDGCKEKADRIETLEGVIENVKMMIENAKRELDA